MNNDEEIKSTESFAESFDVAKEESPKKSFLQRIKDWFRFSSKEGDENEK